uniref:hypothetical protein n=1 Tax=uncultured Thiodictyon sp. TaxID=1846217 RepID=UPI0025F8BD3B
MRFEVKILQQDIPRLVDQLVQITGVEAWRKRFTWLEQESRENQHMREWLSERCGIEIALMEAVATGELKDPASYRLDLAGRYELAAFAAGVGAIHARLSAAGKNRLRGQIVDGLKTDKGLLPLQHEVSTAVHLVHSGFDVCFHDLESGGGFDFLAERDGLAVEVECKVFSGDLGRKIHKRALAKLFLKIRGRLMSVLSGLRTGLLVRITFPVRLSSSDAQHAAVSRALEESLLSADRCKSDECSVAVSEFSVASGPFSSAARGVVSPSDARQFV